VLPRRGNFSRDSASFEPRKAPLDWTALIKGVCEEKTIGGRQSNSFIMSYCATTNKIINIQGKQLIYDQYE